MRDSPDLKEGVVHDDRGRTIRSAEFTRERLPGFRVGDIERVRSSKPAGRPDLLGNDLCGIRVDVGDDNVIAGRRKHSGTCRPNTVPRPGNHDSALRTALAAH